MRLAMLACWFKYEMGIWNGRVKRKIKGIRVCKVFRKGWFVGVVKKESEVLKIEVKHGRNLNTNQVQGVFVVFLCSVVFCHFWRSCCEI